jgi:tetratricopeptide (TPR) repeat protein
LQAHDQTPDDAARTLRRALSLVRGAPLAELDFLQAEQARIDDLCLAALEARVEAELELGEHRRLVGELEQLVAAHPLHEGFRAQLMLALYRSDRQSQALDEFRRGRQALDELGLEPGPALRELELRILNHDPALLPARSDPAEAERVRELLAAGRHRLATEMTGARELEQARDAALALGDPESAAEAEALLGHLAWALGDQAGCFEHLERAQALLASRPPSRAKALVFDLLARRHMTAASYGEAVRFGRTALALCTELADDEGRAESLATIGTAHAFEGERSGLAELDEAIAVARVHSSPRPLARASLNLAVVLETYGEDMSRIAELEEEGLRAAELAEDAPLARAFRAREPLNALHAGRWDDARRLCDELVVEAESAPHYEERVARMVRAALEVGRGEVEAAQRDCRRAIQLCRAVRDPQALYATLAWAAGVFLDMGRVDESHKCAEEALSLWRQTGHRFPAGAWIIGPAFVLAGDHALVKQLGAVAVSTRWLDAALALARTDWATAAELVAPTGYRDIEAGLRLRAAEVLHAAGRHSEAERHLEAALAFYWTARASLHLSRAERLAAIPA